MTAPLDLEAIRRSNPLPAIVGASLKLVKAGDEWKACCPFHSDGSPSFTIFDGGQRFHCFGCGASGDVLDYLQRAHRVGLRQAAEMLGSGSVPRAENLMKPETAPANGKANTAEAARRIWREAAPIASTPAAGYLERRGIVMEPPPTFRFARLRHPEGGTHPCMVALVTSLAGRFAGIQRTYLTPDGRKAQVRGAKLSLGRVAGGAIRLAPAATELVVTEGAEDGLTLLQELDRPVWVAAGASMLPAMQFPAVVRAIVIGADGDAAGEAAARKAAEVFSTRGLAVRIMRPAKGFKDFNQQLAAGPAGRCAG